MATGSDMSVRRNSLYGLLGFALPTAVLLLAYPVLAYHLGPTRFGIYFIATSVSSALMFMDLGLSFATLKFVAEDTSKGDRQAAAETVVTSLVFYGGLGVSGGLLIWWLSPSLPPLFSIDAGLRTDAVWVFRLMAVQFAIFFFITVFFSLFKGMQQFHLFTLIKSLLSVLTYGGAVAGVTLAGVGLVGVTAISLAANLAMLLVSAAMGLSLCRTHGIVLGAVRPSLSSLRRMVGFGLAMSVHSFGSLTLLHLQRLLVGMLIGPAAVTVYVLAFTAVSKVHAVVNAATEVMFPLSSAMTDRTRLRRVYLQMLLASAVVSALLLLPLAALAEPILTLWVGASLAGEAAPVMPALALAYFFIALSPAPFHVVNGLGRPWLNVVFDLLNAAIWALLLAVFAIGGITLVGFGWALAIASVVNGLMFQITVEVFVWRRGLLRSEAYALGAPK